MLQFNDSTHGGDVVQLLGNTAGSDAYFSNLSIHRPHPTTRLHDVVAAGNAKAAIMLLRHGWSSDRKDDHGRSSLHHAAGAGHLDIVETIMDKSAYPNLVTVVDSTGATPLHTAARWGRVEVAEYFLDYDKNCAALQAADDNGCTPQHCAAGSGHVDVINLFFKFGNKFGHQDNDGRLAIHHAARAGSASTLEALLQRDPACLEARDMFSRTPLHYGAQGNHIDVVLLLLSLGASGKATDCEGQTALHVAAHYGHYSVCEQLLELHHDILRLRTVDWDACELEKTLTIAAGNGHSQVIQLIFKTCADGKGRPSLDEALCSAASAGHGAVVTQLLAARADATAASRQSACPLHLASRAGHSEVTRLLSSHKRRNGRAAAAVAEALHAATLAASSDGL